MEKRSRRSSARLASLAASVALLSAALVLAPPPASFSSPGWPAPVNLSPDPLTENQSLNMAVDAAGCCHTVWSARDGGSVFRVWYSRKTGSGWTAPVNISPGSITDNFEAFVALDAGGHPHVVWWGVDSGMVDRIYYTMNTGSGWTAPEIISPDPLTSNSRAEMVIDAGGHPHVVWQGAGGDGISRIRYSWNNGSGWAAPVDLSPGSTSNEIPHLALDADGHIHVVWHGTVSIVKHIWYATNASGTWSAAENLSTGTSTDNWSAGIAVDANGNPDVVWKGMSGGSNRVLYRENNGSGWTAPVDLSPGIPDSSSPRMALDSEGRPHVAWSGLDGSVYRVWYSARSGGTWTAPENLSPGSTNNWVSDMAIGPEDDIHVAWQGNDGATDRIWYSKNTGGGWAAPVDLSPGSAPTDNCSPLLKLDGNGDPHVVWEGRGADSVNRIWYAADIPCRFYFAEGYTGEGFQEYLCLGNPGDTEVTIGVTYLFTDGTSQAETYAVPARSRLTADVNATVGAGRDVSVRCTAASPFVAERPMYFDYAGGGSSWTGGHDAVGATSPSTSWYFAEGYTGEGFDEWICVLNPGDTAADLTFNFQTQEEGLIVPDGAYTVPARSRATFKANDLLGGAGYQTSLELTSDVPVVAERSMYFSYQGMAYWGWTGGHCVMGVPTLSRGYYFAEGYTGTGFEEWLTLQNPGNEAIRVDAVYQLGSGAPVTDYYDIPANTRTTVYVPNVVGEDQDVSVHLYSTSDFLAERPMYFYYTGTASYDWTGGHCVIGATAQGTDWFFAEGYTGENFEEWLCIQNPGGTAATVTVSYYPESGTPMVKDAVTVEANSRYTVNVNADAGAGLSLSTGLTSDQPVIVERPMYFNYGGVWTGGHDVVGYTP